MKELFENIELRNITLKNRIVRSALWMCMADEDGHITPKLEQVYKELAEGGTSLIITGYAMVDANDRPNPGMMGIYNDSFIEEHRRMVAYVHQNDTKIVLQMAYGGSQTFHPKTKNQQQLAPSAIKNRVTNIIPKEMTRADIDHVIIHFTEGAIRAQKAGYDGIELHAAHGYLLSQFLTPYCNRRTDQYGGTIENRSRIISETVQSIRKSTGHDFTIMVKMNHDDYMDDGMTVDESIEVAKILESAGTDIIEISGTNETSGNGVGPARTKINRPELQSYYLEPTKCISKAVNIPVILMGGNRDANRLHKIVNTTDIELFSIARPMLAEPNLANLWEKNLNHKPLCVSCNGCYRDGEVGCIIREKLEKKKEQMV